MATRKTPPKPAAKPPAKKSSQAGKVHAKRSDKRPPPKIAALHPEDKPLTDNEQRFVLAYTTGATLGRPQDAARAAGYAESGIHVRPYELMARPNVAKAIAEAQQRIREDAERQAGISLAQVVAKLGQMGLFNIRDFFDEKGCIRPPKDWPEDCAAAVAGIDVFEEHVGNGPDRQFIGFTKKLKLVQRHQPLDLLMKHLGGYEQDNKQKGDAGTRAIEELTSAIRAVQSDDCRLPIAGAAPNQRS